MRKYILGGTALTLAIAMTSVAYARYTVIGNFSVSGKVSATSANASSSVVFKEPVDATLTIYLEESTNNGSSYQVYEVLDSQSGYGIGLLAEGKASGLDKNCKYRIKAEVVVDGGETEYEYLY